MIIGVDVGGTHTDAVAVADGKVLAAHKSLTTSDVSSGILDAVRAMLAEAPEDMGGADAASAVVIGTTQFTNAVIERKKLEKVAIVRVGAQSSAALPPFTAWPDDLKAKALGQVHMINGGNEYDGSDIVPLQDADLTEVAAAIAKAGLGAVAVCSVFAPVRGDMEDRVRAALAKDGVKVSLSHEVGRLGLYQRENATILNAALLSFAEDVVDYFSAAFEGLDIAASLYISQNDGTLKTAAFTRGFPVFTFSSGPTNSMRGAAYLSGVKDGLVVDVGGTTSDIGMLTGGFPRESGVTSNIGGVETNFRMPDLMCLGLGGGSEVSDGGRVVGPVSVGHALTTRALCFGGDTLTATDIAVAAGLVDIGDPSKVTNLDGESVTRALATIRTMLADGIDRMKTRAGDVPLVAVGGGAFLVPGDLPGVSEVIQPEHAGVANAIGAALAQVSGESETIYAPGETPRDQALATAKAEATAAAAGSGADAASIEIVDIEEIPLSYLAIPAVRLRVRAVGDLVLAKKGAS